MDTLNLVKLSVGDTAPDFEAEVSNPDGSTSQVQLTRLLADGKKVLLIFYPGDDTPGCTKQLCGIRDIYKEYREQGVTVLGVNKADDNSHQKFIKKYNYQFGILIDSDNSVRDSYGAVKKFFKNLITKRGAILIDTDQKILFIHWGQQDNQKIINLLKDKK